MIVEHRPPGTAPAVTRYHCSTCGENLDAAHVGDRDVVDHHCRTDKAGAWWIVRRAA